MASAFKHWLNANLVIQYGVDAVYVEYIHSSLEDGDDGLDDLLESLAPDDPLLRKDWELFVKNIHTFFSDPSQIPSPSPGPHSTTSGLKTCFSSPGWPDCKSHTYEDCGTWVGQSPFALPGMGGAAAKEGERDPAEELLAGCGAGLEGLCLEVAEAVFEEDEDKGGGAIMGFGNGGAAVPPGMSMSGAEDKAEDWEGQWEEEEEEEWGEEEDEDKEEHRIRQIQVALLSERFPQCNPDSLMVVIVRCGYDMDLAVSTVERALSPARQPCRYFLAGCCARSDCTFSHDLSGTTCTYWLLGACRHMDACPFLHDILPCSPTAGYPSGSGTGLSPPHGAAAPGPLEEVDHFPALSATTPMSSTPVRSGPTFLEVLRKNTAAQSSGSGGAGKTQASKAGGGAIGDKAGGEEWRRSRRVGKRVLEGLWAMGGPDLKHTYTAAREAAATAARARNAFFIQSTEAYRRGDKAAAASLSAKGRELNAVMREKHREAALHIFASRNPSATRIYREGVLDLHGLHVCEAVELLDALLPVLIADAKLSQACILTGSGHHSGAIQRGRARLYPAVEEYVQELGTRYSEVVDKNHHKGGFQVTLTPELLAWWQEAVL